MSQTSYNLEMAVARAGLLADSSNREIISRAAEEVIPFGQLVSLGADMDSGAKLPLLSTEITDAKYPLGVAQAVQSVESSLDSNPPSYKKTQMVNIIKHGAVYVQTEQPVTPTDPVYVRFEGVRQFQTLTFDIDFVTGNIITFKVNGTSYTQAFDTDQNTTIAAISNLIFSHPAVYDAGVSGVREIEIESEIDNVVSITDFLVTGGASQAVETIVENQPAIFNVARGSFRKDSGSGTAELLAGARYRTSGTLVILDVNL